MSQDHVRHYFDDCILWNHISDMVPGFVADMGPKLFGLHFTELVQVQLQVLGVAIATQIYIFKSKNPNVVLERLVRALWLSRPFYTQFLRKIRKSSDAVASSVIELAGSSQSESLGWADTHPPSQANDSDSDRFDSQLVHAPILDSGFHLPVDEELSHQTFDLND